jgi:hypothetical protein
MPDDRDDQRPDGSTIDSEGGPENAACNAACNSCVPQAGGPVREKGGTTGENNLSPGGANRTGGATSGVREDDPTQARAKSLTPDP